MKHINKKTLFYFAFSAILLSGMLTITITAARTPHKVEKNVTSVYIEKGDSLWSIAQRYYHEENQSMNSYIEEIKKCNHLSGDQIREGQNLVVPYYQVMD